MQSKKEQSKKTEQKVVDQNIALDSYLSILLDEIPEDISVEHAECDPVENKTVEVKKVEKKQA